VRDIGRRTKARHLAGPAGLGVGPPSAPAHLDNVSVGR
jgi:hypothetical protein